MKPIKELRKICGKPGKNEPWREKLARWISIRITWFLLKIYPKITPNQVTIPMLLLGVLSAFLFMTGIKTYFSDYEK